MACTVSEQADRIVISGVGLPRGGNEPSSAALAPLTLVGEGGYALVVQWNGTALRIEKQFLTAAQLKNERDAYAERLIKLRDKKLPESVAAPMKPIYMELAGPSGNTQLLIGYSMLYIPEAIDLAEFCAPAVRNRHGGLPFLTGLLKQVHAIIRQLHGREVILGECQWRNFVVSRGRVYLVDALGLSFDGFECQTVHPKFVDPKLLKLQSHVAEDDPEACALTGRYSKESDWYSFTVMLFWLLTGVNPWDGNHRLALQQPELDSDRTRAVLSIPVLSPDVIYPSKAVPAEILEERLYEYCWKVLFEKKRPRSFPAELLDLSWHTCPECTLTAAAKGVHCGPVQFSGLMCPCGATKRPVSPADLPPLMAALSA